MVLDFGKELGNIAQRYYGIVINRKTFLIVFNKTTGSLCCSAGHGHHKNKTGALIALTKKEHLVDFVNIIFDEFVRSAASTPNVYIACMYHKDPGHISYGKDGNEKISRLHDHLKSAKNFQGQPYKEYLKTLNITCNENGTNVRRVERDG
uniref:GIY-YIG domain-containing protein n=1 Tax=Panagrolaimus davidi TaxID=227884 RepID=A0A914QW74_9BILA